MVNRWPFKTKYRLGHPEKYSYLLSKKLFIGLKYPKIHFLHFEKNFTVVNHEFGGTHRRCTTGVMQTYSQTA